MFSGTFDIISTSQMHLSPGNLLTLKKYVQTEGSTYSHLTRCNLIVQAHAFKCSKSVLIRSIKSSFILTVAGSLCVYKKGKSRVDSGVEMWPPHPQPTLHRHSKQRMNES